MVTAAIIMLVISVLLQFFLIRDPVIIGIEFENDLRTVSTLTISTLTISHHEKYSKISSFSNAKSHSQSIMTKSSINDDELHPQKENNRALDLVDIMENSDKGGWLFGKKNKKKKPIKAISPKRHSLYKVILMSGVIPYAIANFFIRASAIEQDYNYQLLYNKS